LGAYPYSKAFQILSTYKLKRDLLASLLKYFLFLFLFEFLSFVAEGINAFSLNPGWVWTSIQTPMREALGIYGFLLFYPILRLLKIALAKTPETGARTTIYCAVEPSLERSSDLYFEYVSSIKEYPQKNSVYPLQ
jgi:hypothetical protein